MATNERRQDRRVTFEVDVDVYTSSGVVPGKSVDMSESGMAVVLPLELDIGEAFDLQFKIGVGIINTRAIVRYKNVFRHGFQFVERLHVSLVSDTCQTCTDSGFVTKPMDEKAIAFVTLRCPDCGGRKISDS